MPCSASLRTLGSALRSSTSRSSVMSTSRFGLAGGAWPDAGAPDAAESDRQGQSEHQYRGTDHGARSNPAGRSGLRRAQQPQRGLQIRPSLMMIPWVSGAGATVGWVETDAPLTGVAANDGAAMSAATKTAVGSARMRRV